MRDMGDQASKITLNPPRSCACRRKASGSRPGAAGGRPWSSVSPRCGLPGRAEDPREAHRFVRPAFDGHGERSHIALGHVVAPALDHEERTLFLEHLGGCFRVHTIRHPCSRPAPPRQFHRHRTLHAPDNSSFGLQDTWIVEGSLCCSRHHPRATCGPEPCWR